MSIHRMLLALTVLAATMLVRCHDPVSVPNDVRAAYAHTLYCYPINGNATGWVSKSMDGQTPNGWYADTMGDIKRHYHTVDDYIHPKSYGFCVFNIPSFSSPEGVPDCTLYYHQASHSGSLNLVFNSAAYGGSWPPDAEDLWKAIDGSTDTLAPTQAAVGDSWCKLALTTGGAIIHGLAGGLLYSGWKYTNPSDNWYTIVDGNDDQAVSPYIKVVYYDNRP